LSATVSAKLMSQRDHVVDGVPDLLGSKVAVRQVGPKHERDLGLDLGLQEPGEGHDAAARVSHVVEEHTEVRSIHAKLQLHHFGGQPDLASDHAGPDAQPRPIHDPLHGICGKDVVRADQVAHGRAGNAGRCSREQPLGRLSDGGLVGGSAGQRHVPTFAPDRGAATSPFEWPERPVRCPGRHQGAYRALAVIR
jgi:hypothetical protein